MNGKVMTQCGLLGLACGESASTEPRGPGLEWRASRAHSVRPESCDPPSSPEPAARWFGGSVLGEGLAGGVRNRWLGAKLQREGLLDKRPVRMHDCGQHETVGFCRRLGRGAP